jgi:hypothetical protein
VRLNETPEVVARKSAGTAVYNAAAFRYFLSRERQRAARAKCSLVLIFVSAKPQGLRRDLMSHCAPEIFAALSACVREVDHVGWYRDGAIASALLSVDGRVSTPITRIVRARVDVALGERLPAETAAAFRVRVLAFNS